MPSISLVVCLNKERDLLERLLEQTAGCYDDLVVVHDGPEFESERKNIRGTSLATDFSEIKHDDSRLIQYQHSLLPPIIESIHELTVRNRGRYFEHPRVGSLEGQSPFAWSQAKHNWILRLDADEFPSEDLKIWLQKFRQLPEPDPIVSGYTCIWPLWNGKRATTRHWPTGRMFLFNRTQVRFFGMVEQTPIPDGAMESVDLILRHQPRRKSSGIRNVLFRRQAYRWRRVITDSLRGKPTELPCWRWNDPNWPKHWEVIRKHPLRTGLFRLIWFPLCDARAHWKYERKIFFTSVLNSGLHHFLFCMNYWWQSK